MNERRIVGSRTGFSDESAEVVYGMPPREYHSDAAGPRLSQSLATLLDTRAPIHAWQAHPLLGGAGQWEYEPSDDDGTIVHSLLLEPETEHIQELPFDAFRSNDAKAAKLACLASGHVPLAQGKLAVYQYKAKALRQRFEAEGFLLTGESEVVIYWTEQTPSGPLRCRCRIDHLIVSTDWIDIWDVKTSADASCLGQSRSCWEYGYDIQCAAYKRAVGAVFPEMLGRIRFNLLFCELEKPYAVNPAPLDAEFERIGEHRWERSRNRWAECLRSGKWPSYVSKPIAAPAWAKQREMGED